MHLPDAMVQVIARQLPRTDEERAYYALSERVYRTFATFYDIVTVPFRAVRLTAASTVPIYPDARILDVATGTGAQARAFAARGGIVVGIDLSEAMLDVAQRKTSLKNVSFCRADAVDLPFPDQSFDLSSISFALHEMPRSIRERVVREMARVTKPGGSVILIDYALPENALGRGIVYQTVRLYECAPYTEFVRSDRSALLRRAGIEPVEHRAALLGAAAIDVGRRERLSA